MYDQIWKELWWLDMIETKYAWKRLENYGIKIKDWFLQFMDSLDKKTNPNHSHVYIDANPIPNNLPAAPCTKNKTWVFCQKVENWKLGFRAFQDQITIPLACQGDQETIPIKNISSSAQNRYRGFKLFHIFFIIVF